ncbi:MAG TPA: acyl-CoA dehydrogenase, partial [Pseudomonas pachastrellae]|nr:acyl-CoA dehydrogenase [Halopseudomonas pachastrellae]
MMTLLWLVGLLLCICGLAYIRTSLLNATLGVAAYLAVMTLLGPVHWLIDLLLWALFLGIAIPLNLPEWRQRSISAPLLTWFRKVLPPLSDTEQQALDAGTVW